MKLILIGSAFFLLLLVMVSSSLQAQRFNAGLMLGGVTSQVDGDTYDGYHKWGYLGGGYVSLQLSPHSSFQMELEYIQKGSRRNDTTVSGGDTYLLGFIILRFPYYTSTPLKSGFTLKPVLQPTSPSVRLS